MELDVINCAACGIDHQALEVRLTEFEEYVLGECPETGKVVAINLETGESLVVDKNDDN